MEKEAFQEYPKSSEKRGCNKGAWATTVIQASMSRKI